MTSLTRAAINALDDTAKRRIARAFLDLEDEPVAKSEFLRRAGFTDITLESQGEIIVGAAFGILWLLGQVGNTIMSRAGWADNADLASFLGLEVNTALRTLGIDNDMIREVMAEKYGAERVAKMEASSAKYTADALGPRGPSN